MPTGDRVDPYRGYNFIVEIDETDVAGFSEAGGLTFNVDSVDYREGNFPELHVHKLTGLRKFSNITLKRGLTDNRELWTWYKAVLNGKTERRNRDRCGQTGAFPVHGREHRSGLSRP